MTQDSKKIIWTKLTKMSKVSKTNLSGEVSCSDLWANSVLSIKFLSSPYKIISSEESI